VGAFLTLPRAKPDDTAVERRSIPASRNALAINAILKAAMASPPQIARAHRIGGGRGSVCATGRCFDAIVRSGLTEGARQALQPSALTEWRKINPGWGIPSTRAIAGAKLQSDLLVAIRNP
jgi:hypothetical protein